MKNRIAHILFFGGLLIDFASMFGEYAEQIPFVMRIIAPSYYHAKQGIKTLEQEGSLSKGADGYDEISKILIIKSISDLKISDYSTMHLMGADFEITNKSDSARLTDFTIENVSESSMTVYYPNRNAVSDLFSYVLHSKTHPFRPTDSQKTSQYDLPQTRRVAELKEEVENLKTPNILIFVFSLFFFGSSIAIIGFFMERKESVNESANPKN
ncbi:MAG TPA: hypothetical protein VK840_01575 [Candidatus Dormibacteraeota bacterium]|nr:hypothetical protein [Candidatus Dormibacteraeota bacterium]